MFFIKVRSWLLSSRFPRKAGGQFDLGGLREHIHRLHSFDIVVFRELLRITGECSRIAGDIDNPCRWIFQNSPHCVGRKSFRWRIEQKGGLGLGTGGKRFGEVGLNGSGEIVFLIRGAFSRRSHCCFAPLDAMDAMKIREESLGEKSGAAISIDQGFSLAGHLTDYICEQGRCAAVYLRESPRGPFLAESDSVRVAWRIFAKFSELLIDLRTGNRALGDVHEMVGFTMVKSDIAAVNMHREAVAIAPLLR